MPTAFTVNLESTLKRGLTLLDGGIEPIIILLLETFLISPALPRQVLDMHDKVKHQAVKCLEEQKNRLMSTAPSNVLFEVLVYMGSLENVITYLIDERNIDCIILGINIRVQQDEVTRVLKRVNCPIIIIPNKG